MASFNSGVYGGGNYQFESTQGGGAKKTQSSDIMFDDRDFDEAPKAKRVPLRRIGDNTPMQGGPIPQQRYDAPEPFDDYRPGTLSAQAKRGARDNFDDFEDDFEDQLGNFDDDFDDPGAMRARRGGPSAAPARGRGTPPPRPGSRLSYSRYDDDYTDSDFEAEYSGLHGISSRRKPQRNNRPMGGRDEFDDYDETGDYDDYHGQASIRDKGYQGEGVPRIFAQYFDQQDAYDEERMQLDSRPRRRSEGGERNAKNRNSSIAAYRRKKAMTAAAIVLCTAALAGAIIAYFSMIRVSAPLNVATTLTTMDSDTSAALLTTTVNGTLSQKTIEVKYGNKSGTLRLADCDFQYSTEPDGTEELVVVGEDTSGSDITEKYTTRGTVKFNETAVREFLYDLVGSDGTRMIEPSYKVNIKQDMDTKIYTGTLSIKSGTNGYGIDYDVFIGQLVQKIARDDYSPITSELTTTVTPAINMDKIYNQVHTEAADAYSVTDGAGNVTYVEDVIGVDFDKNAAAAKVSAGGTEWSINLSLTLPNVSLKALRAETFPDLLATYSSEFNSGNKARSSNLALAGDYINNTILQPGETFSFNDTVGERTPDRGFSKATVYSSEGTDEDYGGGICQTSSTLFYAAMKANLELVERRNHMYTVTYLYDRGAQVFGNDATVNWGYTDMKFANNKEYPIKLEVIVKSGTITCNIWGTWDGYTAEYRYVEKSVEPYQTIYRKYADGKKNQAGQLGREVWTYRVVFYEGEEVDRYREFISVYKPLSNIKYVTPGQLPAGREYDVAY